MKFDILEIKRFILRKFEDNDIQFIYNHFSNSLSSDDFIGYLSEAYDIANKVRKKALVRFGAKMFFSLLARPFSKLWKKH